MTDIIFPERAKEELLALMHQWTAAVGAKDAGYFDRHVDDSWAYIDSTGAQRGKKDYWMLIQDVTSYTEEFRRFDVRIVAERVALITGVYLGRVELRGGVRLEKLLAFSAVWQQREGVWRALMHHTTDAPG
ncbi:nuclear transport factor 2 family protein [Polyangium sp. 15x6]|uniref:nuclear transport factor 2 family protein n=1 Tax=Polyangium sp. 15x6 TaxID=3042687 RepID=UPI00249C7073|nr:nuclear transport factor 2 family protein [Polyangium sp. 15x6]MDI3287457.1 nuclear transport factor 2 family protein [Polyangium sp. 15x6]